MADRPVVDRLVLDSWPLLAYLRDESGADRIETILAHVEEGQAAVWMSVVNLGEVLYVTERASGPEAAIGALGFVEQLPIRIVDADRNLTLLAARVKAHHSLSYADAFAVALAHGLDAAVVTGDPEFRQVESLVPIRWMD